MLELLADLLRAASKVCEQQKLHPGKEIKYPKIFLQKNQVDRDLWR